MLFNRTLLLSTYCCLWAMKLKENVNWFLKLIGNCWNQFDLFKETTMLISCENTLFRPILWKRFVPSNFVKTLRSVQFCEQLQPSRMIASHFCVAVNIFIYSMTWVFYRIHVIWYITVVTSWGENYAFFLNFRCLISKHFWDPSTLDIMFYLFLLFCYGCLWFSTTHCWVSCRFYIFTFVSFCFYLHRESAFFNRVLLFYFLLDSHFIFCLLIIIE